MNKASVLIVEDHPIFSKGLSLLIDAEESFSVVGEARNGSEALAMLVEKKPDLAVVDLNLGDEDGLEISPCPLELAQFFHRKLEKHLSCREK